MLYAHPSITSSPELIALIEARHGLRAIIHGGSVRLMPAAGPRTAPPPAGIEIRRGGLFVIPGRAP